MNIAVVNLRPALEATRPAWEARLAELFGRMQFVLGPQVTAFEEEFAAAMGAKFAIGVANGTDAITLSLREASVTGEVITTAMTAPFTGVAILAAGVSRIRFADIDPDTMQIDPDDLGNRLTKKTQAIVPVHLYGQPCLIERIAKLARDSRLALIQDACQAHGAAEFTKYGARVAYSFYPTKNLGCLGDGGAIVTNSPAVAKRIRQMRDGGRRGGQVSYGPGINSRLDEMQACYLRAFLPKLGEWNDWRRRVAAQYDQELRDCPGIRLLKRDERSVCHLYVIRAAKRDRLREALAQQGIGTGIHYPMPMHLHPAFAANGLKRGDLPHTERAAREIVSLPVWPYLSKDDVSRVAEAIRRFYS
jgi:dTDP-3-amino-3,4,6-trideoxy-alpha-D-glucose transaminase